MSKVPRFCIVCGEPMLKRPHALYCSPACQQKAFRQRREENYENITSKADTVPALKNELLAKDEELAKLKIEINAKCDRVIQLEALIRGYEIGLKYKPDKQSFKDSRQRCIDEINSIDILGDLDKEHLLSLITLITPDKE